MKKTKVMTPQVTYFEVLLFVNTYFAQTQFCEKNDHNESRCPGEDPVQRVCWTGLILQLLPEVLRRASQQNSLQTWEIIPAESFIEVTLGNAFDSIDYTMSVNPYLFLFQTNFN